MTRHRIEVGGDFHWPDSFSGSALSWPDPAAWFARGRDTVPAVWQLQNAGAANASLFVPDFFCPDVVTYWRGQKIDVKYYRDDPTLSAPFWPDGEPASNDVVVAVNFFGLSDGHQWSNWHDIHPGTILIEDHTHDPFSVWARASKADYAFASVRKRLPVTDGAILWSPRRAELPALSETLASPGAGMKLAAMILKKQYLQDEEPCIETKEAFRGLQLEGESVFERDDGLYGVSTWSAHILRNGYPRQTYEKRLENVKQLIAEVGDVTSGQWLFTAWPDGNCPFNPVLLMSDRKVRDELRARLIRNDIYAPIHWHIPENVSQPASSLGQRVLTVPVDHRCDEAHIQRIAEVLKTA